MPDRNFPPEMQFMLKDPNTKRAWISENKSPLPDDCPNCGGAGYLYLFVATAGPFKTPGQGVGVISHWYDGGWWIGGTYAFKCPACAATQSPRR